jgi:hypothetical protein
MGFIAEWEPKLGVKIVCSQVRWQARLSSNVEYASTCGFHAVCMNLNLSCSQLLIRRPLKEV